MTTPTRLLWLDLETTQSDPYHPYAAILEIGAIITDWSPQLKEIARASLLIRPDGNAQDHELMRQAMPPVVKEMHQANGLWLEATTSSEAWGLAQADAAFGNWIHTHTEGPVPIAGSGVGHLDVPFVKGFLPNVASKLTYWPLDTGNIRRGLDLAGRSDLVDLVADVDAKPHRGLGDVELHVAEARRYLGLLGRIPQPDGAVL